MTGLLKFQTIRNVSMVALRRERRAVHRQRFTARSPGPLRFNVESGGECAARAGEYDDADVRVGFDPLQSLTKLGHQGLTEGVELFGTMQGEIANPVGFVVPEFLESHDLCAAASPTGR